MLPEKKLVNVPEKGKFNYQAFLEEFTRNSLITSKDGTPLSIPSNANYEVSEEKRKNNPRNAMNKNKGNINNEASDESKSKENNMEIFNFQDNNCKPNDTSHVIHQIPNSQDNSMAANRDPDPIQPAPFTFKEAPNPKVLIQTPKGLYKNVTPFIISSARLPETQKILNSFRDPSLDNSSNLEVKNSAASNKTGATCLICFDKLPDAVFMECGHGGIYFGKFL